MWLPDRGACRGGEAVRRGAQEPMDGLAPDVVLARFLGRPMRPADLLAQIPLFLGLADEDREALAARLAEKPFRSGDIVFSQGDVGSSMYVVQAGSVQIYLPSAEKNAAPVVLKDLRTGEYFGELDDDAVAASEHRRVRHPVELLFKRPVELGDSVTESVDPKRRDAVEVAASLDIDEVPTFGAVHDEG